MDEELKKLMYDKSSPSAYTSKTRLFKEMGKKYSKDDLENWFQRQDTLTRFKEARVKMKRNPYISHGTNYIFHADLHFMPDSYLKHNNGFKGFCVVVDAFSRKVKVFIFKNKEAASMVKGFKGLFAEGFKPQKALFVDRGKEFVAKSFKDFMKKNNVELWFATGTIKAGLAELYGKLIKRKLSRYMDYNNTQVWHKSILELVETFNNTENSATGVAPNRLSKDMERDVFIKLYKNKLATKEIKKPLVEGDSLRLSVVKETFKKKYFENWTSELFVFVKYVPKPGQALLEVKGADGKTIEGGFYELMTQKVARNADIN
jgi:hypothetical protein